MFKRVSLVGLSIAVVSVSGIAQGQRARDDATAAVTVLKPARVFDGEVMHEGWAVRVKGERIEATGPAGSMDAPGARVVDLPGTTLTHPARRLATRARASRSPSSGEAHVHRTTILSVI